MKNDRTIQIIESYLVIIMNKTTPDDIIISLKKIQ